MGFTAILSANVIEFNKAIDDAKRKVDKLEGDVGKSLKNISDSFTKIGKRMSVFSVAFTGIAVAGFSMATDLEDALGATDEVFRQSSEEAKKWASSLSSDYGIAKKEALEYQNLMGTMLQNIGGLTSQMAQEQGSKLIELAGDLTAMYGGTTTEAVNALVSALRGMPLPMTRYGVAVNDSAVKTKALELGLAKTTAEITPQIKQASTLALIWEQTSAAQGQAAREAESASGAMRSFTTAVKNLTTTLGEVLLPILTPIIRRLTELAEKFTTLNPAIQKTIVIVGALVAGIAPLLLALGQILKILPMIKLAVTALLTPMGGIIAGVTVLSVALISLFGSMKKTEEQTEKIASVTDIATESIAREKAQLEILLKTAKDESLSKLERKNAIKKLNEISPEYLGNLNLENINTQSATIATDNYTKALEANARAKAVAERVAELQAKRVDLEVSNAKAQARAEEAKGKVITSSREDELYFANQALKISEGVIATNNKEIEQIDEKIRSYTELGTEIDNVTTSTEKGNKSLSDTLSTYDKLIGKQDSVREAVNKTTFVIDELKNRLQDLRTGKIVSKDAFKDIEEAEKQIKDLESSLATLTGGKHEINLDIKTTMDGEENKFFKDGEFTLPKIDATDMVASMEDAHAVVIDYAQLISAGLTSFASAVGGAFAGGNFKDLGKELIGAMGNLAQQFGSMLIALGMGAESLKKLIKNPWIAIGAGTALVALGAMASKMAQKTVDSAIGGGGSNSYTGTSPGYGASDYRGMYQDNWGGNVTFRIGNNELVGVLEQANSRKNRL